MKRVHIFVPGVAYKNNRYIQGCILGPNCSLQAYYADLNLWDAKVSLSEIPCDPQAPDSPERILVNMKKERAQSSSGKLIVRKQDLVFVGEFKVHSATQIGL
jgi:hypothetical protein